MDIDINIPKTKAVNIFLQLIKLYTYILITIKVSSNIITYESQVCSGMKTGGFKII